MRVSPAEFLANYGFTSLGFAVITFSTIYFVLFISKEKREKQFIDIDNNLSLTPYGLKIENLIEELKRSQPGVDYQRIEELIRKSMVTPPQPEQNSLKSFENYFNVIRTTLEEKATMADQKASILLDKGTSYSKGGITFFVLSIFTWQILSWIKGFEPQFIYGIVSCSVLFIFIEFLSAWFLKQYRQFVDTSTYLIKVKSIFDRYMLTYLVLKEASSDQRENLLEILPLFKEDIKWPESYLLKNGDVSYAKEALETMTYMMKTMKEATKETKEK